MPETRIQRIEHYAQSEGNEKILLGVEEIPYEVSDEELERERAEETISELSTLPDGDIKPPQVGKFLKALDGLRR